MFTPIRAVFLSFDAFQVFGLTVTCTTETRELKGYEQSNSFLLFFRPQFFQDRKIFQRGYITSN